MHPTSSPTCMGSKTTTTTTLLAAEPVFTRGSVRWWLQVAEGITCSRLPAIAHKLSNVLFMVDNGTVWVTAPLFGSSNIPPASYVGRFTCETSDPSVFGGRREHCLTSCPDSCKLLAAEVPKCNFSRCWFDGTTGQELCMNWVCTPEHFLELSTIDNGSQPLKIIGKRLSKKGNVKTVSGINYILQNWSDNPILESGLERF